MATVTKSLGKKRVLWDLHTLLNIIEKTNYFFGTQNESEMSYTLVFWQKTSIWLWNLAK